MKNVKVISMCFVRLMYVEEGVFTGGRQDWPGPEHGQEAGRGVLEHVTPSDRGALFQYHWDVCYPNWQTYSSLASNTAGLRRAEASSSSSTLSPLWVFG